MSCKRNPSDGPKNPVIHSYLALPVPLTLPNGPHEVEGYSSWHKTLGIRSPQACYSSWKDGTEFCYRVNGIPQQPCSDISTYSGLNRHVQSEDGRLLSFSRRPSGKMLDGKRLHSLSMWREMAPGRHPSTAAGSLLCGSRIIKLKILCFPLHVTE